MRIKKHKNKNEYLLTEQGMWVRNFTREMVPYTDINRTIRDEDHFMFLKNEYDNGRARYAWIDTENFYHEKVVIVSDGYGFAEKQKVLEQLPNDVAIIGVHGSLAKWKLARSMNYYVVNNPYPECMRYLPRRGRSLPKCIASTRTNSEFLHLYRGTKYRYTPVSEEKYNGMTNKEIEYQIDDYRNPICAAIGLAYRFGADKLALFCCDDAFEGERPGAERLHNGLWIYPPQRMAHGLIDGCFHWLKRAPQGEVRTADCSSGPLYKNAEYIAEDKLMSYFDSME
jgi:hypothetical protein